MIMDSFDRLPITAFEDVAVGDRLRARSCASVYIVTGIHSIQVSVTYDGAPCLLDRFQFVEGHIRKDTSR